jgi:hypothetical protein
MTLPGAETMKAGIIGDDGFRPMCRGRGRPVPLVPLIPFVPFVVGMSSLMWTFLTPPRRSSTLAGMSEVGEDGELEVGVLMMWLHELDLDEAVDWYVLSRLR